MHEHFPSDGGKSESMATENLSGKVAIPALATTAYTAKQPKKRKTDFSKRESKRESDNKRNKTRVNIGEAFQRWRELRESIGLKLDSELAVFLLDSYEKVKGTSTSQEVRLPDPAQSSSFAGSLERAASLNLNADSITVEEFNDIRNSTIDWADDTCWPTEETESVLSLEEETREADGGDSDSNYNPPFCVRTGGALHSSIRLDPLPPISMEDTVHDSSDVDPNHTDAAEMPENPQALSEKEVIGQPASIAYHVNLKLLAEYLLLPIPNCSAKDPITSAECRAPGPFQVKVKSRATAAIIEWVCPFGHIVWHWSSQSNHKYGMQRGDFMLAMNILLSGNNYAKVALLFKFMNIGMVGRSTFLEIQDTHCVDTIKQFWEKKRGAIISQLQPRANVVVLGDGLMNSPGFCAQYCTYSVMEIDSKKIISMVTVDKRGKERNSVTMEKEAFIRTFDILQQEMGNLSEICTDAHSQIAALFTKGIYKSWGGRHTLDIWYGLKNLGMKIHQVGQKKECSILHHWSKDICNHFWLCAKMTSNYGDFFDMWVSILNHVTGEHDRTLSACHHGPLSDNMDKVWIQKGSVAYEALSEIVLNARWLGEVEKYLGFRSAAELEFFHNHMLMYASERFSFTPPVYSARTLLAGLDYNHHVTRPVKRKVDGSIEYRKLFNKKSQKWTLYIVKVDKDYGYIPDLQRAILQSYTTSDRGMPPVKSQRPDDLQQFGGLSGTPPPATEELRQTQVTQGQVSTDIQLLLVCKEEDPPEQQEWSPSLDQEDPPELPRVKEEQEKLWTSLEGQQPQGLEEADIKFTFTPVPVKSEDEQKELWTSQEGEQPQVLEEADIKFTFTSVPVKSEDKDDEKPQSSQLHQIQTEHMKIEADGEDCGGIEPAWNSDPDRHLQPDTDHNTEPETDDSDDWEKNSEVPVSDVEYRTGKISIRSSNCASSFGQKDHLQKHSGIQTGVKPFSCSLCGKIYHRKNSLTAHMRLHSEGKYYSRSACKKTFQPREHVVTNMRIHTGEKPFSCSFCDARFIHRSTLTKHLRVHTGEKTFHMLSL